MYNKYETLLESVFLQADKYVGLLCMAWMEKLITVITAGFIIYKTQYKNIYISTLFTFKSYMT